LEYKYLDTWINEKGDFSRQLQSIEEKSAKIMGAIHRFGQKAVLMEAATKMYLYKETGIISILGDTKLCMAWTNQRKL